MKKTALAFMLLAFAAPALGAPRDPLAPAPVPAVTAPTIAAPPSGIPPDALAPDAVAEIAELLRDRDPAIRAVFARDMRVAMLSQQMLFPGWAVGIHHAKDADKIVYARWIATEVTRDGNVTAHRVDTCELAMDSDLAQRIEDVWRRMIAAAYTDPTSGYGLDGDSYTFVLPSSDKGGHTWEPASGSKPAALVDIGFDMARLCATRRNWLLPAAWYYAVALDRDVTRLRARLEKEGKKK